MPSTSELALETNLNDLANARLRDKAPALVNYMVGFQLLDSDEDGKRAVGIFGFEIDDSFYYIPVFFLNGEVKGLFAIYSVKSDLFIPLDEDWINLLINRKSQKLGDPDSRGSSERGIRFPDYRRLSQIPGNSAKIAAAFKTFRQEAKTAFQAMEQVKPLVDTIGLPEAAALLGAQEHWRGLMDRHPKLAQACGKFYNYLDFCPAPKVAAEKRRDVVIISGITDEGVDQLTDEQRRDVVRGGIAVSDPRPELEKSLVWNTTSELQLSSPGTNGLYDLLMADGSIEPAICCRMNPIETDDTVSNLMVVTSDKTGFVPYRKTRAVRQYMMPEFKKFLDEHGKSPEDLTVGETVVLVGYKGENSMPFTVRTKTTGADDFIVYGIKPVARVAVDDDYDIETPNQKQAAAPNPYTHDGRTRFGAHGPDLGAQSSYQDPGTLLYAPAVARIYQLVVRKGHSTRLALADVKMVAYADGCRALVVGHDGRQQASKSLSLAELGTMNTVRHCTEKVAQEIKVWTSGDGLLNIRDKGPARGYTKVAALGHLIRDLGMSAHDAKEIVGTASMIPQGYWVKQAAQFTQFPELNDTSDTGYMSQYTPEQQKYETEVTQPSPDNSPVYQYRSPFAGGAESASSPSPEGGPDDTLDVVAQAGEFGSKEVFDAAALSSLIRAAHPTELVERFLPTIVSGMDRLGRLLFLIYWHYEDFEERFGDELPDLIDSLKASFEHVGEIVTELKARSLSGDADFFGAGQQTSRQ